MARDSGHHWIGAGPEFAGRGGAELQYSASWSGGDAGEDRCGAGWYGWRDFSGGPAVGGSRDGGGAGGGGNDCVSGTAVSAAAGDGSKHTPEDDGVVCGFDCEPGSLAGVD